MAKSLFWLSDEAWEALSLHLPRGRPPFPPPPSRRTPYPLDRAAYKRRNVIERMFCKLKNWRRIATRYDRLARNYLSSLALAGIIIART
jgi:transposase